LEYRSWLRKEVTPDSAFSIFPTRPVTLERVAPEPFAHPQRKVSLPRERWGEGLFPEEEKMQKFRMPERSPSQHSTVLIRPVVLLALLAVAVFVIAACAPAPVAQPTAAPPTSAPAA